MVIHEQATMSDGLQLYRHCGGWFAVIPVIS